MKLTNFHIDNDSIALNYNNKYIDLHNNFNFQSFNYNTTTRQLELLWTPSLEEWANKSISAFKLIFREVTFLKVRERDNLLPFTEDSCLSLIGFLPNDLREDFDSFVDIKDVADSDDLNIVFQSEQAFKINCNYVELIELNEDII
jgi:hypothetical protein